MQTSAEGFLMDGLLRVLRLGVCLLVAVVLAGCGGSSGSVVAGPDSSTGGDGGSVGDDTTADSEPPDILEPENNRANLELTASWVPVGDGVVEVSTAVRSLDAHDANTKLRFEFGEGVSFSVVPDQCDIGEVVADCFYGNGGISDNRAPTSPVLEVYRFLVDPAVSDPLVTLTVTGFLSPEFNDPHVENNVVVLDFGWDPAVNAPIAVHDRAGVVLGETVIIDVLDNDIDLDGDLDPGSLTIVSGPELGVTTVVDTGGGMAIEYIADEDKTESYRMVYRVCDDGGRCAEATIQLSVVLDKTDG